MTWFKNFSKMPDFIPEEDRDDILLISPDMIDRENSIKSPGWVKFKSRTNTNGVRRIYAEPLISFSGSKAGYVFDEDDVDYGGYDPVTGQNRSPIVATGLNGVTDWASAQPFIDVFKTARDWIGNGESWGMYSFEDLKNGNHIDENGWVRSIPADITHVLTILMADIESFAEESEYAGRYRLFYEGEGQLSVAGSAFNVTRTNDYIDFSFSEGNGNLVAIEIHETNPTNYIRNIRVVNHKYLENFSNGEIFNPEWIKLVTPFRCARFMDWMGTNNSPIVEFVDYPTENYFTWTRVPFSVMVQLANTAKVDAWFNIPHMASDDFVEKMVGYIADNLNPSLNAYYEYSNEFWNWQFGQSHYCSQQGQLLYPITEENPDNGDAFYQYGVTRSMQIFEILSEVYQTRTNYKKVFATHTGWLGLEGSLLEYNRYEADNPDKPAPRDVIDYYCVTGYFEGGFSTDTNSAEILDIIEESIDKARVDSLSVSADPEIRDVYFEEHKFDLAEQKAYEQIMGISNHLSDNTRTIPRVRQEWEYHRGICDNSGFNLMMYEGGTHMIVPQSLRENQNVLDFYAYFSYTDSMALIYEALLDSWKDAGGDMFNIFVECNNPSQYGYWGAKRSINDDNPRWDAIIEYNNSIVAWWEERDIATFV